MACEPCYNHFMEKTVLIVEDDKFILSTIAHRFTEKGFKILLASTSDQAEKIIRATPPDLVLLDIILPDENGLEFLKRLKADPIVSAVPVMIFSNLGSSQDIKQAMELGAVDYIVKASLSPNQVISKVTDLLSVSE